MSRNYRSIAEPKTLSGDVTNVATQITLSNVTGLPSPPYVLVLSPDTATEEAVLVTVDQDGVTSPTLKVQRAIETGATAQSHTNLNEVRHMIVGSDLQLVHDHLDNTTTAHGATGAVVGTTNSQTLTNKTLTTPKINENVNLTATSTELNVLDGITASTAELNIMDGVTASTAELNILDGATLTTTELNYVDGVTSAIQTQFSGVQTQITGVGTTITNNTPVGVVNMWVTGTAPTGWLICDGTEKAIADYSALAGVLSTTYGNLTNGSGGVGTTHFRLPDFRGRTPMGAGTGTGGGVTGTGKPTGGETLTARTLGGFTGDERTPKHTHGNSLTGTTSFASTSHGHTVNNDGTFPYHLGNGLYYTEGSTIADVGYITTQASNSNASVGLSNAEAGTGETANIQPSTVINFIIKY